MIGIFLLPFPVRAIQAPYLWVFYKWLSTLDERACFLLGEDYLRDPAEFERDERWECGEAARQLYGYRMPDAPLFARHDLRPVADDIFPKLLDACSGNPVALFRAFLTTPLPLLQEAIDAALETLTSPVEFLVTWCNCPSLNAVAQRRGIPVVHLEVGPLRAPLYRPTAYLDLSGVNGNTEAAARYATLPPPHIAPTRETVRAFLFRGTRNVSAERNRVGVALQVEDDSNLIAFGHGFDNQALVTHAGLRYDKRTLLVRSHPGSLFRFKGSSVDADGSYDSLEFIERCGHVLTINSSVAVEADLLDTSITLLGESPFRFVLEASTVEERDARRAFFLFGYLIPESLQFDLRYLRWRATRPPEGDILVRHLSHWGFDTADVDGADYWRVLRQALAAHGRNEL